LADIVVGTVKTNSDQPTKENLYLHTCTFWRIASSALHRSSGALDVMKRPPHAVDKPILTYGKPVSDALSFLPACASDSFRS
jgi:hypothetical protein